MKKWMLLAGALALAGTLAGQAVEPNTAERWISMCRPVVDARVNSDGTIEVSDSMEAGRCIGALEAISVLLSAQDKGNPVLGVCPPQSHTLVQWAAMFTDYAKRHPRRYLEPFAIVMIAALQESYPCRSK